MIVYVDDFKLSGLKKNLPVAWQKIRKHIATGELEPLRHFLGCTYENVWVTPPGQEGAAPVPGMSKNMEGFFTKCVKTFKHLAGPDCRMKKVPTPFLQESPGPSFAPSRECPWLQCPYCKGCYHPDDFKRGHTNLPASQQRAIMRGNAKKAGG